MILSVKLVKFLASIRLAGLLNSGSSKNPELSRPASLIERQLNSRIIF